MFQCVFSVPPGATCTGITYFKNNSVNKKHCCFNRKNNSTGRRWCVPFTANNSDLFLGAGCNFLVIMVLCDLCLMTAGLQGWTPFQACDRMRLLGSLQPCTFCRRDPVAKDSRQLHCGHQSLVSEHRAQAAVTEASCGAPTVACHISRHRPLGCWREITHKGTLDPRHLHVQLLFTRPDTCSLSVVATLTPPPLSLTTRTSSRTSRVLPAAS